MSCAQAILVFCPSLASRWLGQRTIYLRSEAVPDCEAACVAAQLDIMKPIPSVAAAILPALDNKASQYLGEGVFSAVLRLAGGR